MKYRVCNIDTCED